MPMPFPPLDGIVVLLLRAEADPPTERVDAAAVMSEFSMVDGFVCVWARGGVC